MAEPLVEIYFSSLSSCSPLWLCSRLCQSTWSASLRLLTSAWTWTSEWPDARKSVTTSTPTPPTLLAPLKWVILWLWLFLSFIGHGQWKWFHCLLLTRPPLLPVCLFSSLLVSTWKWWLKGMDKESWKYEATFTKPNLFIWKDVLAS